jgi:putative tricarboxylic transport membrane protein
VLLLSVVGTYSANKNVFDLWVMLGFGIAGYVLHKLKYDLAPFIIAFVLAPLLEQSLRQSLAMSPHGAMIFIERPATLLMLLCSAGLIALMFRPLPNTKGGRL